MWGSSGWGALYEGNPAQKELLSLRVVHVLGRLNQGADMLSRNNVAPGEWNLHPQMVQMIWSVFSKEEFDLFASGDNCHCPTYFSKQRDALAHDWPNARLYAFPPIVLLPQVIRRIRETKCSLLLVAPLSRNQVWFPEMIQLLSAAPQSIPRRRDLLSQAQGKIWHSQPELWSLHVWPLVGSLVNYQRESLIPFKRLELHLHDTSTPSSGQSSVTGVQYITRIQFHVTCPTC